jgi:hypothetical protein
MVNGCGRLDFINKIVEITGSNMYVQRTQHNKPYHHNFIKKGIFSLTPPLRSIYSSPTAIAVKAQSINPALVSRIF